MTIIERERIDRNFKRLWKICKWFRKNVNIKLGNAMLDKVDCLYNMFI